MSPFKRTERAAAKQRAGRRHAAPGGPVYPLMRTPVAQLLLNPNAPSAEVPPELAERDYEFPQVQLPASRPLVDHTQLLAALDDDEPTQELAPVGVLHFATDFVLPPCEPPIGEQAATTADERHVTCAVCLNWLEHVPERTSVLDGLVLGEAPQPAQHEGLKPVPVPSLPFLNAHPPRPDAPTEVIVRQGNALPARLTAPELMLLGRPIPADAPSAVRPPKPGIPAPVQRDREHQLVFGAFDAEFWEQVETTVRQRQAGPGGLRMSTDDAMAALDEHLARVERAHRAGIARVGAHEYASHLADASRPLPRRTPGAALKAIEASRGELVAS
jgi:hypothetical protein